MSHVSRHLLISGASLGTKLIETQTEGNQFTQLLNSMKLVEGRCSVLVGTALR